MKSYQIERLKEDKRRLVYLYCDGHYNRIPSIRVKSHICIGANIGDILFVRGSGLSVEDCLKKQWWAYFLKVIQ
jgi:hypothetical protein